MSLKQEDATSDPSELHLKGQIEEGELIIAHTRARKMKYKQFLFSMQL